MLKFLIEPYLRKIVDFAFKMIKIWAWVISLFLVYVLYSSKMWYNQVQQNAELSIQLAQNKTKIDSLKIYQSIWKHQNETLRLKIKFLEIKTDELDSLLTQNLKNDKKLTHNRNDNPDNTLRKFTERYGKGSVRQR